MSALDIITNALSSLLPELRVSNGTIENKIVDVVATYADSEKAERDSSIDEIFNALANQKVTTKEYYRRKAVEFQQGDLLKYDPINQGAYYDPINPENQIIKQAYITGTHPAFTLLVNALGTDGHLRKLSLAELASFRTYFRAFQPLGMDININSLDAAKVYAPNLIIYVQAGSNASDVATACNDNFLAHEQEFRQYNAVTLTEIEDVIQKAPGVIAVDLGSGIYAEEVQLDGTKITTYPVEGILNLVNGAFTFATEITVDIIQVL